MRKKIVKAATVTTKFSAYWLAFFLLMTGIWVKRKFGEVSFEQVIYHLQFGAEGVLEADTSLVRSFIRNCFILPTLLALFIYSFEKFILSTEQLGLKQVLTKFTSAIKNVFIIIQKMLVVIFRTKFPIIFVLLSSSFFLSKIAFWTYITSRSESNFIATNYVTPRNITYPANKKNLVLIYVESLENTYSNKEIFGEDLLKSLNDKTKQAITFKDFKQTTGTGWTIAGIVSSQCGIPLKSIIVSDGNSLGESIKKFLPNAICLGDILKKAGYKNIYIGGDDLSFSGKGKFFQQHGYSETYGKKEWQDLGYRRFNDWGLFDDELFAYAKNRIIQLENSKKPYNITITTIDTHHPSGHISPTCKKQGVTEFTGIVKCTSDIVADFIDFMSKKGYLKNTNVIILGDHLAMKNTVYDNLLSEKNRRVFNRIITTTPLQKNRDDIYHFSMFPTILYSLGFKFEKNRLGLGASGIGELDPNFALIAANDSEWSDQLAKFSRRYLEFWQAKE